MACSSCATRNRVPVAATGDPRCARCHTPLPWLVDVDESQFAAAVSTARLVLVDLWADWCGPCRMVAPILERLAAEFAGRLKVVKVDVDRCPAIAQRFKATSIPMLVFLRHGEVQESLVGAQPEHALRQRIDRLLTTDRAG